MACGFSTAELLDAGCTAVELYGAGLPLQAINAEFHAQAEVKAKAEAGIELDVEEQRASIAGFMKHVLGCRAIQDACGTLAAFAAVLKARHPHRLMMRERHSTLPRDDAMRSLDLRSSGASGSRQVWCEGQTFETFEQLPLTMVLHVFRKGGVIETINERIHFPSSSDRAPWSPPGFRRLAPRPREADAPFHRAPDASSARPGGGWGTDGRRVRSPPSRTTVVAAEAHVVFDAPRLPPRRFERWGNDIMVLGGADCERGVAVRKWGGGGSAFAFAMPAVHEGVERGTFRLDHAPGWEVALGVYPADSPLDLELCFPHADDHRRCALALNGSHGGSAWVKCCHGEHSPLATGLRWAEGDTVEVEISFESATTARVDFRFKGVHETRVLPDVPACGLCFGAGLCGRGDGVTLESRPTPTADSPPALVAAPAPARPRRVVRLFPVGPTRVDISADAAGKVRVRVLVEGINAEFGLKHMD